MSTVNPTTGSNGSTTLGTSGTTISGSNTNLGENDFLQLMMDQLKNQDPLQPSDPSQYLSELAGFSTLEQETSIATSSQTTAAQQSAAAALQLLGHTVTYTNSDGTSGSGTVQKVDFTSSGPSLTIGGVSGISLSSITEAS
jgi:flagellar basal-body rod modification protein FlgD